MTGPRSTVIPMQLSNGCLVVSIQVDLAPETMNDLRKQLLEKVKDTGATAVIFDMSGMDIIDDREFEDLKQTIKMLHLMGVRSVLSGLKPAIISALTALDVDLQGVNGAMDLDQAHQFIEQERREASN